MQDEWEQHLQRLGECKSQGTCPRLTIRELFYEPNPKTIETWQEQHGFYKDGIDRRVVFVCESPSDRRNREEPAHFTAGGQAGWICWNLTAQDRKFREARMLYGYQNCLLTNSVKCGLKKPSTPSNLTTEEVETCSGHLVNEIEMAHPLAIACMGGKAFQIVKRHVMPKLSWQPFQIQLTHYSARGSSQDLQRKWQDEFALLNRIVGEGSE